MPRRESVWFSGSLPDSGILICPGSSVIRGRGDVPELLALSQFTPGETMAVDGPALRRKILGFSMVGGWPGLNLLLTSLGCSRSSFAWARPLRTRAFVGMIPSFSRRRAGPLGFNLDDSVRAGDVVTEAAPWPILGSLHQSALDGVAMNVAQLLHKFAFAPIMPKS